jgi:ketosteroid isomerase-like protein
MSQENVEVIKAAVKAWNASDMEAFREMNDPDVFLRAVEDWPEPGPYVGRDAVMGLFAQARAAWDSEAVEPISFVDAGDRVVMRYIWRAVGHGPDVNMEQTIVYTLRKSRVVYQEYFWNHAEALETVGLSEQDAHADS